MSIRPTQYAILFNGPPGSGKDFAAQAAQSILTPYVYLKCRQMKLAAPLKKAVHALFDLDVGPDYFEGVMKDTAYADLMSETPRNRYIQMSEEMVKPLLGTDFFGQVAARRIKRMSAMNVFLFSDCGFTDEVIPIIATVGAKNTLIVEIEATRNGQKLTFEGDSRAYIGDVLKQEFARLNVVRIPNTYDRDIFRMLIEGVLNNFLVLTK